MVSENEVNENFPKMDDFNRKLKIFLKSSIFVLSFRLKYRVKFVEPKIVVFIPIFVKKKQRFLTKKDLCIKKQMYNNAVVIK